MSPEPFVSRAKAPPAKRSEKGYGDENGTLAITESRTLNSYQNNNFIVLTRQSGHHELLDFSYNIITNKIIYL